MPEREHGSQRDDAERQEVERIVRKAEALGHDPQRVARAMGHVPLEPAPLQQTVELKRRPAVARLFARGNARRP